jgi:MarR family 2-MHQ and catechol resistance regulon transcriptional repressor
MAGMRRPGLLAWTHLMRVYNKMNKHSMDQLKCSHVTTAQFEVLAQLTGAPGISQQELSEKLLVTKGNICGLLDRLEEQRLVERRPDPEDRRSHRLYLTQEGRELADRIIPEHEDFIQEHMSTLSDEEQRTLLALLRDLDRSLERHKH